MKNYELTYKLVTAEGASKPTTTLIEEAGTTAEAELRFAKVMSRTGMGYEVTMIKESRISEIIPYEDPGTAE